MSESLRPLTERRQLFVQDYLIHCNASRAARNAGYSAATAASIGSELLTMPNVKAAIARGEAERAGRRAIGHAAMSRHTVPLAEIAAWMVIGPDGKPWIDLGSLVRDVNALLRSSRENSGSVRK